MTHSAAPARPRLEDFRLDPATGVHLPPWAGTPAGYLDGAERLLQDALPSVRDRGIGSEELAALVCDWPTEYHLTPYRSTIFETLGFTRAHTARVLELGCGCGAVTRWLGERCGEVHAIEGDADRAHIAALRCEDLGNTRVFAANYSELTGLGGYDVATLIGVLEYGHLYHPRHREDPDAAAADNLRMARAALNDDGLLVLAIENRLGLKYLNGAREDHSGRLYEGIQGYPDASQPVTWSARALTAMLHRAGFAATDLLLPFPDYKLARTVINPARATDAHAVHNWIDAPAPDRGADRGASLYNEHLATRELVRAGILPELSNSFLMLAWAGDRAAGIANLGIDLDWSARHYSLDRKPGLRKQVTLRGNRVEHAPVLDGDGEGRAAVAELGLHHELAVEPHRPGDSLLLAVFESLTVEGIGPRFREHLSDFRAWLLDSFAADGGSMAVDGRALDATWWNVLVHPDTGEWQLIDEEWSLEGPIPVDFVVWRMVRHFALRYGTDLPEDVAALTPQAFADACVQTISPELDPALLDVFAGVDDAIQVAVSPAGEVRRPEAMDVLLAAARPPAYTLVALASELAERPALLSAYARAAEIAPLTLVVYAPDEHSEEAATTLRAAIAAAGVREDDCDLVLLAAGDSAETMDALAEQVDAILSDGAARLEAIGRRQFGHRDARALAVAAGAVAGIVA